MKYYRPDPELDARINEIKRKIRLSMNGVVYEMMTQNGIVYKKNFGVPIPRIKEIAKGYEPNHDLAQRLWSLKIRETMIMATLLEPADKFTPELAHIWAADLNQVEIVEQATMNLLSKLSFANELVLEWIGAENRWAKVAGFLLAARIGGKLTGGEVDCVVLNGMASAGIDDYHLYKSVAVCFSRLCRRGKDTAASIWKELETLSENKSASAQYISSEVKQEILFLDIL
ncbi:MAG TPA: DNA alkylation repair protein [Paludibacter sp.]|nr:DNA alkylation repair protein [Paludibacter sp.]